ncbi:MAG TPA: protein kinase, partial [Ktedonobacterales bacterium]|nr:protein kinase [Ktedonobacterales bacterium]
MDARDPREGGHDVALWTDLEGLTVAGRYELHAHLATGGMAAVFRGWDLRMRRPVAVKLLRDDAGDDLHDTDLARFRREARAIAALRSPHIVEVYDFVEDGGRTYLIMELVDGPNLKQRIHDAGPLSADEALTCAIHVCRALAQAH